ncbi:MAG: hypothetical protein NC235_07620 [Clostridiales bacterium]|nr:hypothetical protein [Clostridiales bacterium]MCM1576975.1 hypothetical protein [Bacteroides sp.]
MAILKTISSIAPYVLRYKIVETMIDDLGNPVSYEQWSDDIECDVVPAGRANERTFEDGERRTYSYTIYLKNDCPDFALGQSIELCRRYGKEDEVKKQEYEVLGFVRYQLQSKLWV